MSRKFFAEPPLHVKPRFLMQHMLKMFCSFGRILWQIIVPFKSMPEEIESLPEQPKDRVKESHVKQCQWLFDQAEKRRLHLEQKAQSTFGLMVFLVPLLVSIFVYLINIASAAGTTMGAFAIALPLVSGALLLLGFVSAVRAVSVKAMETLFLRSVVDEDGQFREYKEDFHARGLLYCTAKNEAMNDHVAQFVKGAHVLTAAAIMVLAVAVVPIVFVLSNPPHSPTETKIIGPVEISSPDMIAIGDEIIDLKRDVGNLLLKSHTTMDGLKQLEGKLMNLDAKLTKVQKEIRVNSTRQRLPQHNGEIKAN